MKDISGIKFGRHTAIKPMGKNKWGNYLWLCRCECGNEHVVASAKLIQGKSRSCGCLSKDVHIKQLEKHGITTGGKPRTLIIWSGMKARCNYPNSISYKSYGARGISVCDEWLSFENFHNWAISNGYKDALTLDRIDNNGNYEPSNCRWTDATTNKKNQRHARYITINGITKNVSDWCKYYGISKSTAYKYLNQNEESFIKYCKGQTYFVNKFLATAN